MKGIITLCGSTKFRKEFDEVNRRLTWSGYVVLSVGSFHHSEKDSDIANQIMERKVQLDVLHKEKIAMSRGIVVLNIDGYLGDSTKSEISRARDLGVRVFWYDIERATSDYMESEAGDDSPWLYDAYDGSWLGLLDERTDEEWSK